MPMRVILRIHGTLKSLHDPDPILASSSTRRTMSSPSASTSSGIRTSLRTAHISWVRRLLASQRGDSGSRWMPIHSATAGTEQMTSIQRHTWAWGHMTAMKALKEYASS